MIAIKICGITSLKDAELAVNYGASAIGLIFYPDSLRYVDPAEVEQWIEQIPDSVKKVGVFGEIIILKSGRINYDRFRPN